ncbi:MAG: DUF3347 domain-containing protein [Chitinophagaceae bacterium]|nr:DUF3347 domain-containing protein [Chitinophagaceae bacterium]MCB0741389.1 DUF3347 domain-containing protein [Chitinophagaceae bacterium]HQU56145.1 DUF3347 domain-containing protein [Chitinophagaceae bacterium]HQV05408.1 DUF3347 domain-containing protein [Chitinophagaceae bacterium]
MRKIIEIAGIILPLLIIALGIIRIFVKKTKGVNGLTIFFALLLLIIGLLQFYIFGHRSSSSNNGPETPPLAVSQHSAAFNESMNRLLNSYYDLSEGFVNWDISHIYVAGKKLQQNLDSLQLSEIKKDTLIYETAIDPYENAKADVAGILADKNIASMRQAYNILSNHLRNLLVIVKYDGAKVYWQECPMAFNGDQPGNWLSRTIEVRNPYLGNKDPKYGDGMLDCGGPKDTINFIPANVVQ